MSEVWSFQNLNLSGIEAQRPSTGLPPGKHVCVLNHAELKPSKSGMQIILYWDEIEGKGSTRDYITLHSNSKEDGPQMAERIGKERFKAVLEFGGHPHPDNPHDIHSLAGMVLGVICEQDEDWVDDRGVTRRGGVKPRRNGAYMPATQLGYTGGLKVNVTRPSDLWSKTAAAPKTAALAGADMDDDIPF